MRKTSCSPSDHLWIYTVMAPLLVGIGSMLVYGIFFSLQANNPTALGGISLGRVDLWTSLYAGAARWVLALTVLLKLRRTPGALARLFAPQGRLLHFRWRPAIAIFVTFNAITAILVFILGRLGEFSMFAGLSPWLRICMVLAISLTAAFTEELIWRGFLITRLEARGRRRWPAIVLAALSFMFMHASPMHWVSAFVIGLVGGYYYTRQRSLAPLMLSHFIANLWSFAIASF